MTVITQFTQPNRDVQNTLINTLTDSSNVNFCLKALPIIITALINMITIYTVFRFPSYYII